MNRLPDCRLKSELRPEIPARRGQCPIIKFLCMLLVTGTGAFRTNRPTCLNCQVTAFVCFVFFRGHTPGSVPIREDPRFITFRAPCLSFPVLSLYGRSMSNRTCTSARLAMPPAPPARLTVTEVQRRLAPVLSRYADIETAMLFGSVCRGEASRRSDVDLLIVRQTEQRFLDRARDLLGKLSEVFPNHAVELFVYTPEELRAISDRAFIRTIPTEGIRVYERDQATS